MKIKVYYSVFVVLILFSCNKKEPLIGIWDDNIKLSQKAVQFSAGADSVIIKTEGDWWWVNDIFVDDVVYSGFHDIDLEKESYIIEGDCFVVERKDKNTLFIKLDKNTSNSIRIMSVGLEAGDYFDRVSITQKCDCK